MGGVWRLLLDGEAPGTWNMGVDEALLETAARGGPATLRLYGWRGPWLSLGYAQADVPERRAACAAAGVGVVRRATGGRAVLHGGDLTYAVAAPETALPPGLAASYALLAEALLAALRRLGVAAQRARAAAPAAREAFDCFAAPAADELSVGGRKLAGSAQRRAGGALLQHGSLRLRPDPPRARRAAGLAGAGATSLAELGVAASPQRVREVLAEAFGARLGVALRRGGLAPEESRRAAERFPEGPGPRGILKSAHWQPIGTWRGETPRARAHLRSGAAVGVEQAKDPGGGAQAGPEGRPRQGPQGVPEASQGRPPGRQAAPGDR